MSTGQSTGAQAPIIPSQPIPIITSSVSDHQVPRGRQGITDTRDDGEETEFYDDEEQEQERLAATQRQPRGTVLNVPRVPAPPLSSTPTRSSRRLHSSISPTITSRRLHPFSNPRAGNGRDPQPTDDPEIWDVGGQLTRVVPLPEGTTAHTLCQLASVFLQVGADVPPEIVTTIATLANKEQEYPQALPPPPVSSLRTHPIIQEPVTVPPVQRDRPPHMTGLRASARRDGIAGGGAVSSSSGRRSDEPVPVVLFDRSAFNFFDCFLDLSRSSPSPSNPFSSVMVSIRKNIRPSVSHITPLSRRNQWRDWDHAVGQIFLQWRLVGFVTFVLPEDSVVPSGTPPWLRPVPVPDRSGTLSAEESSVLVAWEDLDLLAREILGLTVSSQAYRLVLGGLSRRKVSYTARDLYAALFDRFGHASWDSGNMVWERARRMSCASVDAVPGFVDVYLQAVREVDESLMVVPAALMIEVMLEALPRPDFSCLLDDFRRTKRQLGATVADLAFADVLSWADFVMDQHRQVLASSFRVGRPRRPLPVPPGAARLPSGPSPRQLTSSSVAAAALAPSSSVAAAALAPSSAVAAGGAPVKDPQSRVPGSKFSSAICDNCKIPGHTKAQCLKPGGDRHKMGPSFNRSYLADDVVDQQEVLGVEVDEKVQEMEALVASAQGIELDPSFQNTDMSYVVNESEYSFLSAAYDFGSDLALVSASAVERRPPFNAVLDSGCTRHVLNDLSWFHDFTPIRLHVGTANSKPLVVHGKGVVRFSVRLTDGSLLEVSLDDCLYAPTCPVNLLSVGALTDVLKWRIMFSDRRTVCWRHVPGSRPSSFLVLPRSGRLSVMACDFVVAPRVETSPTAFLVDTDPSSVATSTGGHFTFVPPKLTAALWHCRLGHPGREAVRSVLQGGVVDGVTSVDSDLTFKCVDCIRGRFPALPFDNNGNRFESPGALMHIDTCGPFPVRTMGCRYFIVVLDDATNFSWTCLMKTRDQAFGFFKFVEARLLTLLDKRVIRVRLDGAAELCKGVLEEHFRAQGISYQVTARYAHQQNGKAERYIRTIQDSAAVLMVASGLNQSFWGWAVKFAQYVRNRIPTSTLPDGLTPYEALMGVKPDVSNLRVFGCRCYPLIPPELRRKGDLRRYEAIFLGFETDRVGWTVMAVDGRVIFAHDVIFDESTVGGFPSPRSRAASLSPPPTSVGPGLRRSSRIAEMSGEAMVVGDVEVDGMVLESPFGDVLSDGLVQDVGSCWLALGVAADILRRVTVEDDIVGVSECAFVLDGVMDQEDSGADDDGAVFRSGGDFWAFMSVVGHRRIFDDLGDVLSSLTFHGRYRDLDGDSWGGRVVASEAFLSYDLSKPPASYMEAIKRPDKETWWAAMRRELGKLRERGTFEPVARPSGKSLVGVKWVFDYKYNSDGSIIEGLEKARLVAQGFSQREGDYGHTHSPVATKESVNATYAITAHYDHELYVFDIKQAFTHSKVREEVYCRQIPGFPEEDPRLVLRLRVALYGLKQAAFEWYCLFLKALLSIGLRRSDVDHAYFIGVWKTSPDPEMVPMPDDGSPLRLLVPIHVDDGLASTNSTPLYQWFLGQLKACDIEVVDLGVASMFLGARIHRDRGNRKLWVSQSPFVTTLLEDWKMYPCNPAKVPLETLPSAMPDSKPGVLTDHMPHQDLTKAYQSLVGSFQYLASTYRPEISTAAMVLGHHSSKPESKHMAAAKHVLRYLYGTRNYVLMFDPKKDIDDSVNSHIRAAAAFMDADWASDSSTRLSISGYAIYFMGSLVGWSSVRQRVIALSSTEAEYYAIVHAAKRVLWFRLFLMTSGIDVPSPFPMLIDNKSAIAQASSPAISARSKHIHIKYLFIKNYFGDGTLTPTWVSSSVNVADIFTKLLSFPLFDRHRTALGIVPSP
ncbi:hypothetical protein MD484_g5685, partial [Candolleomyces efflorescens]